MNSGIHQLKANLILLMDRTGEETMRGAIPRENINLCSACGHSQEPEPKETKSNQLPDYVCAQSLIENGNP